MSSGVASVTAQVLPASALPPAPSLPPACGPRVPFRSVLLQMGLSVGPLPRSLRDREPALPGAAPSPPHGPAPLALAPRPRVEDGAPRTSRDMSRDRDDDVDGQTSRRRDQGPGPGAIALVPLAPALFEAPASRTQPVTTAHPPASIEELLPALVRRVAWSGDGHRGSMRLELGAGELAGGTLLVHADAGRVSVHLEVPPGADAALWQRRLHDRLASKGVPVDLVEVT